MFKTNGFLWSLTVFQSFIVIFPWSHDLEQVMSLSVWLCVRRTPTLKALVMKLRITGIWIRKN